MNTSFDIRDVYWYNEPKEFDLEPDKFWFKTRPFSDLWQKTHYGFSRDTAHLLLDETSEDFTFTVKTSFSPKVQYDQCGVVLYQSEDCWFKASIEYENENYCRLGSVVTNLAYSDWATTDLKTPKGEIETWYRLSRRGSDFLIEHSADGNAFQQMRIFHLYNLSAEVAFGVYACSPKNSSVEVTFSEFKVENCTWPIPGKTQETNV
jgi:hypothetical protein